MRNEGKESNSSAPVLSSDERRKLIRKAFADKAKLSKWEIRALYGLTRSLFLSWMKSIDGVDERIPNWEKKKCFKPAEAKIILENFGEVGSEE